MVKLFRIHSPTTVYKRLIPVAKQLLTKKTPSKRNKKQFIVEAAVKVFLENGYADTTFQKVADEAGVIRATIYSHFKDKEQLFTAIIEELTINKARQRFETGFSDLSIDEFIDFAVQFFNGRRQDHQYLGLLRIVIGESQRFPELARLYSKTIFQNNMKLIEAYIKSHPELGIKKPLLACNLIGGSMVATIIQQEFLMAKEFAPVSLADLGELLKDLLTRPPSHFNKTSNKISAPKINKDKIIKKLKNKIHKNKKANKQQKKIN